MRNHAPLRHRLNRVNADELVGREAELTCLVAQLTRTGAVVSFVHGIGGIGKSSLLSALAPRLEHAGARVLRLDGRAIEPTARGFIAALASALDVSHLDSVEALAAQLSRGDEPTAFIIDEYDHVRLIDDWLRQVLLPAQPERTRWYFAGRFAPRNAWLGTPGWADAVMSLKLGALSDDVARTILARRGIPEASMAALLALSRGTPLALTLVTTNVWETSGGEAAIGDNTPVLAELAHRSVQSLRRPIVMALEALCVVRRATRDVLASMLGETSDDELLHELEELSFVELAHDGLSLHETVRHALESRLLSLDPQRHRRLRAAAFRALETRLSKQLPVGSEAWRLLADLLFLVEQPEIREAFFPSAESRLTIEAANLDDYEALQTIVQKHEPVSWQAIFDSWWQLTRSAFRVARDGDGRLVGFILVAHASELPSELETHDPLLAAWQADVRKGPAHLRGALLMRRALSLDAGDRLDEVRAAVWLDIKRAYVERPMQWALYTATRDVEAVYPMLSRLGFTRSALEWQGEKTLRLEFGANGIWGWLRNLLATLGDELPSASSAAIDQVHPVQPFRLDTDNRRLVVEGRIQPLSALEYRTFTYLLERAGKVVTRNELLDVVWEQRHTGSNVVDAVIRLLRKKLGAHGAQLETVRGHGYRLNTGLALT